MYDMPLYRPPSEGDNLIVQATLGCSHNHCSFCAMYKSKAYVARPLDDVCAHIDELARMWPDARRVFLADGDALALPTAQLEAIADKLAATFPGLQRISAYATPGNLLRKGIDELERLKAKRLSLLYVGMESGSAEVLRRIAKGVSPERMVEALDKARAVGMKVSATVILGLGGRALAAEHIAATAELVNRAPPNYLSTLQLTLVEQAAADFLGRWEGQFKPQTDDGILREQLHLLEALAPPSAVIFRSNHASNCLALAGTLPKDNARLQAEVTAALEDGGRLRPDWLRGL